MLLSIILVALGALMALIVFCMCVTYVREKRLRLNLGIRKKNKRISNSYANMYPYSLTTSSLIYEDDNGSGIC